MCMEKNIFHLMLKSLKVVENYNKIYIIMSEVIFFSNVHLVSDVWDSVAGESFMFCEK